MARKRQFKMVPVSTAICAAGGYTAQFTDQEEAKDALEFMPAILRNAGIRLDQAIFAKFCRRVFEKMVEHTARTGEWATWTKVMTSRLYILGRFEAPDATVPTENIELVVIPLEGFRLDLTGWTLQNVNAGNTLELKTISDQGGTDMGAVTGTRPVEIHGVNCPVDASKEDEGVWLSAKAKSGEEIVMQKLTVVSSDVKTVVVANPGSILAPFEKATFTVRSRAGNPEGQPQEKEISAAVKYAGPVPIAESEDGLIKVWKIEPVEGEKITLGKNTKVTGEMLGYNSETGEGIMGVHLVFPGGISYECGMDTIPPESTELILKPGEIPEGLEPGDYEVEMQLERVRDFAFAEMITVHNLPVTVEAE